MTEGKPTLATTPPVRHIDLSRPQRVHLVGIGGAGMSAIATVLAALGHTVTGSDQRSSVALERLTALGLKVFVGHDGDQVGDAEIVARSTAIPDSNPEVLAAHTRDLAVYRRDEILSAITNLRRSVGVGGTHGKTSTSSMLTMILRHAGLDPSFIIGGRVTGLGIGAALGTGDLLIVEADESDGTFLRLNSRAAIVTSVEPDHLDYYGSVETFEAAFVDFLNKVEGPRLLCVDDEAARRVASAVDAITYGTSPEADYVIADFRSEKSEATFAILHDGAAFAAVELQVPGVHNARNATAAVLMAHELGVPLTTAIDGLHTYAGVGRRYESRGEAAGVTFIDDYAHLPSEVAVTLEAARTGGWDRIICVFQPHRYTRTAALGETFADAFVQADHLVITSIYSAGEAPIDGVTGRTVADPVGDAHPDADVVYLPDRSSLVEHLLNVLRPGDLCLTLNAGDLTSLPDDLMARMAGHE